MARSREPQLRVRRSGWVSKVTSLLILIQFLLLPASAQEHAKTYQDTRRLLLEFRSPGSRKSYQALAKLFKVGDTRLSDLIAALDDPHPVVPLAAIIVLRYLGNERGLDEVTSFHQRPGYNYTLAGPVPLPLREWDFTVLERTLQTNGQRDDRWWDVAFRYAYALALDGTPRAQATLQHIQCLSAGLERGTFLALALDRIRQTEPRRLFSGGQGLANAVLGNAFFLDRKDREIASAKLLSWSAGKDRALVEVFVGRDVLNTETWHVVVVKSGRKWRFFSVTLVAVS